MALLFSDGCRFSLKMILIHSGCGECLRRRIEEFFSAYICYFVSMMVWGCVRPNGIRNLAICQQPLNAKCYPEILQENIWNSIELIHSDSARPYIFQKDSAACHTANHTKRFFKKKGFFSLSWTSQSPDLNAMKTFGNTSKT